MVLLQRQQKKTVKPDLGFGYRFLNYFCMFCGHRFDPISGWRAYLMLAHQVSTNLVMVGFFVLGSYNLYISLSQFSAFLYFSSGFITIAECVFRTAFIIARHKQIVELSARVQFFLTHPFVQEKREKLLKRLTKRLVFLLIFFMVLYGLALYFNAVVIDSELIKVFASKGSPAGTGKYTAGLSKFWVYLTDQLNFVPQEPLLTFFVYTFYVYSFLMVGRLVATEFLFFSWYWLFLEQYELLTKNLPRALNREQTREERIPLKMWLQYQQDLSKFLCDTNKFLSPIIGSAVMISGFKICILAIVCVKLAFEVNVLYMAMFGVISIQRVYIYCIVGQKIKEKISELHAAAFRCSWFKAKRQFQNAALMICSAASERAGLTLPGSPFFALSLEFFASIMSAVFTYFIVIIQIQK